MTPQLEKYRHTGRTTRMLDEAVTMAEDGKAVYVVCHCEEYARQLERKFGEALALNLGIKFESISALGGSFNWATLRTVGSHQNAVFLVDHYLIETKFNSALKMLYRYNR